jgi:hypothetical protein
MLAYLETVEGVLTITSLLLIIALICCHIIIRKKGSTLFFHNLYDKPEMPNRCPSCISELQSWGLSPTEQV